MNPCSALAWGAVAFLCSSLASHADLVGWWDFEEGSGPTTADQSGGGHTGTLGAGASWSTTEFAPVPSGSSASIQFDGTDLAHVIMNGYKADEVGGTNSRTLAAWIKSAPGVLPSASNLGIFGYGQNQAGDKFNFRTQQNNGPIDGNIRTEVNGGYIIGSTVVIDGEWHHVAMTWEEDGTPNVLDVLLYVDGVLETISASLDEPIHTDTVNGIDLAIGDDHSNREWNGWLDDIRIYDEVLTAEQILELATGTFILGSFTADAESIAAGGTVTLSWEADPALDTLSVDNGVGDVAPITVDGAGSIQVMPAATTTYTLTGTRGADDQTRELTVLVNEAPTINTFEITGALSISAGSSTTLRWSSFGADTLTLTPGPLDVTGETEATVSPTETTVYTLTATNAGGSSILEVTVTVVPPSLLAHFDFEEGSGTTTTDLVSGLVGNLDPSDGTGPTWDKSEVPPLLGGSSASLDFDGVGDRVVVTGYKVPEISGTTARTVMAWVKSRGVAPNGAENMGILAYAQDATGEKWILRSENGNGPMPGGLRVEVNGGFIVSTTNIVDGNWHHVAATFEDDGTPNVQDILLYVDGQLEIPSTSQSQSINTDTADGIDLRIGDDHSNRKWNGWIDDVRIYNYALTMEQIQEASTGSGAPKLPMGVKNSGDDLVFTWESKFGKLYTLRSELDPSASDPIDWPIFAAHVDLVATPPQNTLTIPRPAESSRFFVIEEHNAPPVPVFTDDFEAGPGGWTTNVSAGDGSTAWMHGSIPAVALGPGAANSGSAAFGTNLAGAYTADHTVVLVSPVIDLTGAGDATLRYFEFKDIEPVFDAGSVSVLDAADDSVIAVIASGIEGLSLAWTEEAHPIPAAALDKMIKIEFRLVTDDFDAEGYGGWYLDDVQVTIP